MVVCKGTSSVDNVMSDCIWQLPNHFKEKLIFSNSRSPKPCFIFEAGVTFFETSESISCLSLLLVSGPYKSVLFSKIA